MKNKFESATPPQEGEKGDFRDPSTAEHVDTGIIPGVTDKWNTEACYQWDDGYWEVWADKDFVKDDAVIAEQNQYALVAKGDDKDGWKKVDTAEFCEKR